MRINQKSKSKLAYRGLLVFLALVLSQITQTGMIANLQPLLLEPVTTSLNISRPLYSSLDALTQTCNLIASLFLAVLAARIGIVNVFRIGVCMPIIYCLSMFAAGAEGMSAGARAVLIGIGQGALGISCTWAATIPIASIINNWFAKRRGFMLTIATSISSLSSTLFSPIVASWIMHFGWAKSLLWRGLIMLAVAVIVMILVKEKPSADEVRIWESQSDDSELNEKDSQNTGLTLEEAIHTLRFYLLILYFFIAGGGVYAANAVLPAYCSDVGHPELAGIISSILMFSSMVVALPMGGLLDKFGCKRVFTPIIIIHILGMIALSGKSIGSTALIFGAVCVGIAFVIFMGPTAIVTRDLFGDKDFARVSSYPFAGFVAGFIVMYPLANVGYQFFGSYRQVFMIIAGMYVVCLGILFYIGQDKYRIGANAQ